MRKFGTKNLVQVSLFGYERCLVDMTSVTAVKNYANSVLKERYRKTVYERFYDNFYPSIIAVKNNNGCIQVRWRNFNYCSKNTIKDIAKLINSIMNYKNTKAKELQNDFIKNVKNEFPKINWKTYTYDKITCMDAIVNGIEISVDNDWNIELIIPTSKSNACQIINYIEKIHVKDNTVISNEN